LSRFALSCSVWRGVLVALKTLRTSNGHECSLSETAKQLYQEIGILSLLKHPNIVSFVGSSIGRDHMISVTEYMPDGDLYAHLRQHNNNNNSYSIIDALHFAKDIARAMEYVHDKKMLQCDLKTSNVLLTPNKDFNARISQTVKLNDFGSAVNANKAHHIMGTVFNAAPELLSVKCVNTYKTDVYAFGMIMWELLERDDPFKYIPVICLPLVISNGRRPYLSNTKRLNVPIEYIHLMEQCWHPVPSCRPSFSDISSELIQLFESMKHVNSNDSYKIKLSSILPKRDMDRTDKIFSRFLLHERRVLEENEQQQQQQQQQMMPTLEKRASFDKTLNLNIFKQMVMQSGKNMSSMNASNTASLMAKGIDLLYNDLKVQTTNHKIDKWHLISALSTLRQTSMTNYSLVMAACEMDGKRNAQEVDFLKVPVQESQAFETAGG